MFVGFKSLMLLAMPRKPSQSANINPWVFMVSECSCVVPFTNCEVCELIQVSPALYVAATA